jgi:uncharacterized protein (DUF302 family)
MPRPPFRSVTERFARLFLGLFLLPCALSALGLPAVASADDEIVRHSAKGSYEDVKDAVVMAIEGRGLVVDRVAHVGDMLARTAKDVGATRRLYGNAEVLEFCSARLSREMMEADPHQIAICPFTIAVYTLPGEAGTVYVSYRSPPRAKGLENVRKLLDEIVREALK